MRTLFLNPPSFEGFDGGAGSRWPSTREIESYWYPVWICYPAGMIPDSKVLDAPPHGVSIEQTVAMARDYELMVLFTSSPGFDVDVRIAEMIKDANPKLQVAFVGPPVTIEPDKTLNASKAIDFIVRREFDYQIVDYAKGKPLSELPGASYRKNGVNVHNPEGGVIENLDELPWVSKVYKRDLDFRRYNVPFLLNPYISFYTTRGCPAMCTFCLWPQTHSGHRWRLRSAQDIASECRYVLENFPGLKEIFFDDDTFNCRKLGLVVHGDFIVGLPGETRETLRNTIDFAKRIDAETIQVSIAHAYPGTELYDYGMQNALITLGAMTDETGHQLPNITYPGLDHGELVEAVEQFDGE